MKIVKYVMIFLALLMPGYVATQSQTDMRAQEGDQVWLIINHVKSESRQEFEQFMEEVFFKLLKDSQAPNRAEQIQKTRWLTPAQQNQDGTWAFAFLMDPVVEQTDYEIVKLFQEQYSPEKAAELFQQYLSYIARTDFHVMVQAKTVKTLQVSGAAFSQETNPLLGAWELISGTYNLPDNPTERSQPDDPYQLKVFSPGHFAYVHLSRDGSFNHASAGTYRLEGNKYIETHNWHSSGQYAGMTVTLEFRIEGDLLYMKSISILDAEGKPMEEFKMMEEVRRRVQ